MRRSTFVVALRTIRLVGLVLLSASCGDATSSLQFATWKSQGGGYTSPEGGSGTSNNSGSGGASHDPHGGSGRAPSGAPEGVDASIPRPSTTTLYLPTDAALRRVLCPLTFTFQGSAGVSKVRVAGEWQGFDLTTAQTMAGPSNTGAFTATVELPPGLWGYKLIYEEAGQDHWGLDPAQGRRKYVGGIENSAVKVSDCRRPTLTVVTSEANRIAAGAGTYRASLAFRDGLGGTGADPLGFTAVLDHEGTREDLDASRVDVDDLGNVMVALDNLEDGKYRVTVRGKSRGGPLSDPLRLVFWIESEAFSWRDALLYMVMTDRYRDGDPSNNLTSPTPGADPRGDFMGGDLEGVRRSIADGTFDKLGVRALWLTPFATNPEGAYMASDNEHRVTGYHGYWPVKAREVDPRLGGAQALTAMVTEAHRHGIRVLSDFVAHHVHRDHEYIAAHPEWFQQGCVCGSPGCDFTAHAQDCLFADYLPRIDYIVPEASQAFVSDAIYWLDDFDLDGLRIDAVKHVPELATRNVAAEVRETFEASGTRMFLMGETAMGWNDCGDPCNDENYNTISRYIGPLGLDGQFDFVLYHGVSYRTFAYGDTGMMHADYWFNHGVAKYPKDAIMTPYLGSHDTSRFGTLADYRGQDTTHDRAIPDNQWIHVASAPRNPEPYRRARVALSWLLALPGAPLLYYGDEYGQWGGADPNNRLFWRTETALDPSERATLNYVRKLGSARKNTLPLRRGAYVSLGATDDTLTFGRLVAPGQAAIVGITRATSPETVTVAATDKLGLAPQSVLHDALGGPDATVDSSGTLRVAIPAGGAVMLAP